MARQATATSSATASAFTCLLDAAEFTLDLLDNLSTGEFAIGGDRPARLRLAEAISRAKVRTA